MIRARREYERSSVNSRVVARVLVWLVVNANLDINHDLHGKLYKEM